MKRKLNTNNKIKSKLTRQDAVDQDDATGGQPAARVPNLAQWSIRSGTSKAVNPNIERLEKGNQ